MIRCLSLVPDFDNTGIYFLFTYPLPSGMSHNCINFHTTLTNIELVESCSYVHQYDACI
jgi:hypothetical protein